MSSDQVARILKQRSEFLKHLKQDVERNTSIIDTASEKLKELKITSVNIKDLGKKVEHPAVIPLGKRIYVNGTIIHTGEYFLDKLAFPDSYSTVETLDATVKHLENKIEHQSEQLKNCENAKEQLQDRIALLEGGDDIMSGDSPQQIVSDKGVAVKVGDFYEILEFEN